jgi:hypothetical protein
MGRQLRHRGDRIGNLRSPDLLGNYRSPAARDPLNYPEPPFAPCIYLPMPRIAEKAAAMSQKLGRAVHGHPRA